MNETSSSARYSAGAAEGSPGGYSGASWGRACWQTVGQHTLRGPRSNAGGPDFPAESAEKNQDQAYGQYDDADGPDDRKLEQKAGDEQAYTEGDHAYSLRQ
jgi:hypothetical protein